MGDASQHAHRPSVVRCQHRRREDLHHRGTTRGVDKLAVVEAYDPETDTWTRHADMPTPRNALSTVVVEGKIYAIGGWGFDRPAAGWASLDPTVGATDFSTVEVYDPRTDTWTTGADMPTPRSHMAMSAVDGTIYAIGGWVRREGVDAALSVVEAYDIATDSWTRAAADMPTARWVPSSSVIDGRIYVSGGTTSTGPGASLMEAMRNRVPVVAVEVYDPASGRWTTDADLATARGWHSTSVVNGTLYAIGGRSPAPDGGILEVRGAYPGPEDYTPGLR